MSAVSFEPGHSLASFAGLVDPRVGIIRSVNIVRLAEADPYMFLAYAEPADTLPLFGIRAASKGAACAVTLDRAILRACGESLERYCSACYDEDALLLASEAEIAAQGRRFIPTRDLYPYAPSQYEMAGFPFEPVAPDTGLCWCRAQGFSGGEVLVPASCVYVPYRFREGIEPFTHMPISTGLAAGRDVAFCVEKGVCEILERDALMIGWLHRRSPPRLAVDSVRGLTPDIDALLEAVPPGCALHLVWLTLDIPVPIIGAALVDPGEPPLTSFGISADIDPAAALSSAIEEAMLTRLLVNRMEPGLAGPDGIRTLHDHLKAHAFAPWSRKAMHFLLEAGPQWEWDAVPGSTAAAGAYEVVRALGHDGAWIEVTSPDVANYGFHVVRTVMPGFQPLDNDHRHRYLGGRRLTAAPRALGLPPRAIAAYNSDPHPFP